MAIITPDGLFNGDRLGLCTQDAQLYWHRYFIASNTCGRLELNYRRLLISAYANLPTPPTEATFWSHMREYADNFLLFTYEADGTYWGQWDTPEEMLQRHKLKADLRTPAPPQNAFQCWKETYQKKKQERAAKPLNIHTLLVSRNVSEKVQKNVRGVGVGGGVGEERQGEGKATTPQCGTLIPNWLPAETWNAYSEMRKKIRKPMTIAAATLVIKKLDLLRSRGHPPKEVLEQSILNSWQGVFEIKGEVNHGGNGAVSKAQQRSTGNQSAILEGLGLVLVPNGRDTQQGDHEGVDGGIQSDPEILPPG